ncbi:MAG: nuclear transport factor 2 family protein [Solirubrobacterales bacterium]|jgi:ketosteroid isomerase-like protein|nr:nuclear transport factor 2 family protein [Solirubrobacterales bacterium]
MSTAQTSSAFDLRALRSAIESRDAAAQAAMFADDAEVVMVDRDHPPGEPQVLRGIGEIRPMLDDLFARDMTHQVQSAVTDGERAAYVLACRYPDGTRVLCSTMLELDGDRIARQVGVQAWDG